MLGEPSEDEVQSFMSFTSRERGAAIQWLQRYSDLESAVNAFYETGPDLPAETSTFEAWDERAFHTDKNQYGPQNLSQTSFAVHAEDTLNPAVFDGTITRPPTRNSIKAMNTAAAGTNTQTGFVTQEDEDMDKAMTMSLTVPLPGQELGVVDASGTHFRPATRAHYDDKNWSMMLTGHRAQEILQNPEPEYRKRELDTPAFVKPLPSGSYMPALITILHAIPLAREALLARGHTLPDYGSGKDWWDGTKIERERIVYAEQPDDDFDSEEIIFETQRLMAFLDLTERAYGSAAVLANMEGVHYRPADDAEAGFLETWESKVLQMMPEDPFACVFRSVAHVKINEETELQPFYSLEVRLPESVPESGQTLYEAMDEVFWASVGPDDGDEIHLDTVADIFTIRVCHDDLSRKGLGIKIPATWYPDRYLRDSIGSMKDMRRGKEELTEQLRKIQQSHRKLTQFQLTEDGSTDARRLLDMASAHFTAKNLESLDDSAKGDLISFGTESIETTHAKLAEELHLVADSVSKKLKSLELATEQAVEKIRELSRMYTSPLDDDEALIYTKYTLRGVSTDPTTTYVLRSSTNDDDLMGMDTWQWWKISFSPGDIRPVTWAKVREVEVLKAAKDESNRALLVYANEKAIRHERQDLPAQLRNFVRTDNLFFSAELDNTMLSDHPTLTKRKANESYNDNSSDEINWGGYKDNAVAAKQAMAPPQYRTPRKPVPPPLPHSTVYRNVINSSSSCDDMIPLTLQVSHEMDSPTYEEVDLLGDIDQGQEMKQRSGMMGMVPGGTGAGVGEYALGTYSQEIRMDDMDDEEGARERGEAEAEGMEMEMGEEAESMEEKKEEEEEEKQKQKDGKQATEQKSHEVIDLT